MKEEIFFFSLCVCVLFQIFYILVYPATIWALGIGFISGFIVTLMTIGVVAGVTALTIGLNDRAVTILFVMMFFLMFFFQIQLPQDTVSFINIFLNLASMPTLSQLPLGVGLIYPNMSNVFLQGDYLNNPVSLMGFAFISLISVLTISTGVLIASGSHD